VKELRLRNIALNRLKPWDGNPRRNEKAVQAVAKSIRRFGFNVPVLCDRNYVIIAGHTRLEAAKRLRMKTVPAIRLSLQGSERKLFAIADNRTGELADWDTPKLKEILDELHAEDLDLSSLGFSARELRRLLKAEREREDALPEAPKRARTSQGTLWKLGRHRLLCGDSRHKTTFARLVGKTQVDHVFAGPPYFNQRAYSHWDDYAKYLGDVDAVIARCYAALKEGGIVVWNVGNGSSTNHAHVIHHATLLEESGFRYIDMIVWTKSGPCFSVPRHTGMKRTGHYYPAHQWESLLVFQKPGPMPQMSPKAAEYMWQHNTDVWEIPAVVNQMRTYGHPAVCPVEVPYRTLQAYSPERGAVLDPFGGSGSTLVAAERAGRRALLLEKAPEYCDQIVKRWEGFTGNRGRKEQMSPKPTTGTT